MSFRLYHAVIASDLDRETRQLAMALAEIANDDGLNVYPGVEYLSWALRCGERTVQTHLAILRASGILRAVCHPECATAPGRSHGRGQPVSYQLVEEALPTRPSWAEERARRMALKGAESASFSEKGAGSDTERVQNGALKGAESAPDPFRNPIRSDPDRERSREALAVDHMLLESLGIMSPPIGWSASWLGTRTKAQIATAIGVAREKGATNTRYVDRILEKEQVDGNHATDAGRGSGSAVRGGGAGAGPRGQRRGSGGYGGGGSLPFAVPERPSDLPVYPERVGTID